MNLDDGKLISDIVESALRSGDLSKLRDIGPAVQKTVTNAIIGEGKSRTGSKSTKNKPSGSTQTSPPPPQGKPYYPTSPQAQPYTSAPPQRQPIQSHNQGWSPLSRKKNAKISKGMSQIVLSTIATFIFGMGALTFLLFLPTAVASQEVATIALVIAFSILTIGSAGFLIAGVNRYKMVERVIRLANQFQGKNVYTFEQLAAATSRSPKQIKKDLRKARERGIFPELHVDDEETCVMWGEEAYQQYLETKRARQQRIDEAEERKRRLSNPQTADIENFRSEGQATIRKIREANDAIQGKEISAKLDALEETTDRIFVYVARYPQKLPDTRKFMSYYLPTTLKLVEKYRQFDEMEFQPENIKQAKQDIESALDTINMAFANLLESLFDHETMDVVTDIDVLKKMLEQEGLTNKEF